MENLSISIFIPALADTFDFIVPKNMPVKGVEYLILKVLNSRFGTLIDSKDITLFDRSDGKLLNRDCSLYQLGINDGAVLVLV